MVEGEGFQIVLWDVLNPKKREKKGVEYVNSGQVILKSVNLDQVSSYLIAAISKTYFYYQRMVLEQERVCPACQRYPSGPHFEGAHQICCKTFTTTQVGLLITPFCLCLKKYVL